MTTQLFSLHAGPKRTASTFLQKAMTLVLPGNVELDQTAHEGNSHGLALAISLQGEPLALSVIKEAKLLNELRLHSYNNEISRLRSRINTGQTVCISCELFAQIHPAAVNRTFNLSDVEQKQVVFVYRDTAPLLSSLFSNSIAGGYRGTIDDFFYDIRNGIIHTFDIFPPIQLWRDSGWKVLVRRFDEHDIERQISDILSLMCGEHVDVNSLKSPMLQSSNIVNKRLSPPQLLQISLFLNAINEYPSDLRSEANAVQFVNQVLLPFVRDTVYTASNFDLSTNPRWKPFLNALDEQRRYFKALICDDTFPHL